MDKKSFSGHKQKKVPELQFENFPAAVCITNQAGDIIRTNAAFRVLTGISQKQSSKRKFRNLLSFKTQQKFDQFLSGFWESTALMIAFDGKMPCVLSNGKHILLSIYNCKNFSAEPSEELIILLTDDIESTEKNKRYESLFNLLPDVILIFELDSNFQFSRFIEANSTACRLLGYGSAEFQNLSVAKLFSTDFIENLNELTQKFRKTEQFIFEATLISKRRVQIPVEINAVRMKLEENFAILFVAREISQHKRVEKRLIDATEQLRDLALHLQHIREEERSAVAREIHDELGQMLTVLKIQISLLANKLDKKQPQIIEKIKSVTAGIDQSVESIQKISAKLRPVILDELGLAAALEWQSLEFEKNTGIFCDLNLSGKEINLNKEIATALFRIFQEVLTNVARHAFAKKISVNFRTTDEEHILEITDNGVGIRQAQIDSRSSLGILGMKERAAVFGGKLEIHGVNGKGTNVKITIPFEHSNI